VEEVVCRGYFMFELQRSDNPRAPPWQHTCAQSGDRKEDQAKCKGKCRQAGCELPCRRVQQWTLGVNEQIHSADCKEGNDQDAKKDQCSGRKSEADKGQDKANQSQHPNLFRLSRVHSHHAE
jgi:hypothetical protein